MSTFLPHAAKKSGMPLTDDSSGFSIRRENSSSYCERRSAIMCNMEKLKELVIRQMRAAADLYEVCMKAENELTGINPYDDLYLRTLREFRTARLEHQFDLTPAKEETDLWNDITE